MPGGLARPDGTLAREAAFRALDGRTEAALWEARGAASRPAMVTALLAAALETPSGGDAMARALSVGDRHWLLARLAEHLGRERVWLTGTCATCGAPFDAPADLGALPAKPGGEGYPEAAAEGLDGPILLRAPTGADQEAVAGLDEAAAAAALLARCAPGADVDAWPEEALDRLDAALAELSPEVAGEVATACPACGAACRAALDLAEVVLGALGDPYEDVHAIAAAYHWSEAEILALPTERRRRYLRLIDRARGMAD
jgi:hypothetical protein